MWRAFVSARAQATIGVAALAVGFAFWALGTFTIATAAAWPWLWSPGAFIFHASMFFGIVACYAIVSNAVGIHRIESVEQVVTDQADVEHADTVQINNGP